MAEITGTALIRAALEGMLEARYSSWHRFAEEDEAEPEDMQLARLALQALRQEEGMVLVPRDLLTAAGLTLPADSPNAKRIWAILNAAKNPTDGQIAPNESARSDGIGHATTAAESAHRLGAEDARERVRAKYPEAFARQYWNGYWKIVESPAIGARHLHTAWQSSEDAAWIDAAGRV